MTCCTRQPRFSVRVTYGGQGRVRDHAGRGGEAPQEDVTAGARVPRQDRGDRRDGPPECRAPAGLLLQQAQAAHGVRVRRHEHPLIHASRSGNPGSGRSPLRWESRRRIALNSAHGLEYIHATGFKVAHIKSSNILLVRSMDAQVADHGLASMVAGAPSMRLAGCRTPEAEADQRRLSQKVDVYSFVVLLLEMLTGKAPTNDVLHDEGWTYCGGRSDRHGAPEAPRRGGGDGGDAAAGHGLHRDDPRAAADHAGDRRPHRGARRPRVGAVDGPAWTKLP